MALSFTCDHCNRPLEVDDEAAGQFADCPHCRRVVPVPRQSQSPPHYNAVAMNPARPPIESTGPRTIASGPPAPHFGMAALASVVIAQLCICMLFFVGLSDAQEIQATDGVEIVAIERGLLWPLLYYGAVGGCTTAVFTAIVSLSRKEKPRWMAITALSLITLFVCGFTGFMMLSAMMGAII